MTAAAVAAAVGAQRSGRDKGKAPSDMDYSNSFALNTPVGVMAGGGLPRRWGESGSASGSVSGSRSSERLRMILEDVDETSARFEEREDDYEMQQPLEHRHIYRRKFILYTFVPLCSAALIICVAFLPRLLSPHPLPSRPSVSRQALLILLGAALWTLAHGLRKPLFLLTSTLLTSAQSLLIPRRIHLRDTPESDGQSEWTPSVISILNAVVAAWIQESLRLSSLSILDLQWRGTEVWGRRASDAVFYEVWSLALGWAIAEVCAGTLQGYEQLMLYENVGSDGDYTGKVVSVYGAVNNYCDNSNDGNVDRNVNFPSMEDERAPLEHWPASGSTLRDAAEADLKILDEPHVTVDVPPQMDVDSALSYIADARAREDLEDVYGEPYLDVPVPVVMLQRLDSLLLSLGQTLILGVAFLPPPASSPSDTHPHRRFNLTHTFVALAIVHSVLSILHAPPVLPRIGLAAAAYVACMVGLALSFAGVGIWVGVW